MSAEYSMEEALTMIDRIAIAYGSQELEDARAVLAERIKADRGMVPDSMIVLLNHIEGLMDSGILPEDVIPVDMWNAVSMHNITHPPAQAAQAFALPKSFVDRATSSDESEPQVMGAGHLVQFTTTQVDWLMTFNARLIVNGLHPEDARMWMRATDQWDFDADPVAEADSTWQDFFANPDDDGPFDPTPTAEPVAQGEAVQQEEYGGPDFEERCETLAKIERDMRIYLDEGMLLTPYTLELLCNRIKNVRDAGHDNVVMSLYNFRTLRRLAAQPRAVPGGMGEAVLVPSDTLLAIVSALDVATGDSDPNIDPDMTDEEVRDEYPEVWAMQQLSAMLAAAGVPSHDA